MLNAQSIGMLNAQEPQFGTRAARSVGAPWLSPFALGVACLFLGACGNGDESTSEVGLGCQSDPKLSDFPEGEWQTGKGGTLEWRIVGSVPELPTKGDNQWTIELRSAEGLPVSSAEIRVTPFMPQHGHGTAVKTMVTPGTSDGSFVLSPVNLWMPGLWEVKTLVTRGTSEDEFSIWACIRG